MLERVIDRVAKAGSSALDRRGGRSAGAAPSATSVLLGGCRAVLAPSPIAISLAIVRGDLYFEPREPRAARRAPRANSRRARPDALAHRCDGAARDARGVLRRCSRRRTSRARARPRRGAGVAARARGAVGSRRRLPRRSSCSPSSRRCAARSRTAPTACRASSIRSSTGGVALGARHRAVRVRTSRGRRGRRGLERASAIFGVLGRAELDLRPLPDLALAIAACALSLSRRARARAPRTRADRRGRRDARARSSPRRTKRMRSNSETTRDALARGAPLGHIALQRCAARPIAITTARHRSSAAATATITIPSETRSRSTFPETASTRTALAPTRAIPPPTAAADLRPPKVTLPADLERHPHHDRHAARGRRLPRLRQADDAEPRRARGKKRRLRSRVRDGVVHGQERRAAAHRKVSERDAIATAATSTSTRRRTSSSPSACSDAGFHTMGAASHWYFKQWSGLSQGMDDWRHVREAAEGQGDNDTSIDERQALRRGAAACSQKPENTSAPLLHVDPLLRSARAVRAPRRRAGFLGAGRGGPAAIARALRRRGVVHRQARRPRARLRRVAAVGARTRRSSSRAITAKRSASTT